MRTFLVRAMSEGLQWVWRLLAHILNLLTLVAVLAGIFVVGVLLDRAAWLIAGVGVVLVFVVFAQGAYRVWRETYGELTDALEAQKRVPRLKHLLGAGLRLQGILEAAEEASPPYKDDPVYYWARETWEALAVEDPSAAKTFFGDKTPYQDGYFETAFVIEVEPAGRRAFLDSRISMLEKAVEAQSTRAS